MKKYSLDEKVRYNRERGGLFGLSYNLAVQLYRDYPKSNKNDRQTIDNLIAEHKNLAQQGDQGGKGFMCGLRDAATDRKLRKKT